MAQARAYSSASSTSVAGRSVAPPSTGKSAPKSGGFTPAPNISLASGQTAAVTSAGKVLAVTPNKSVVSSSSYQGTGVVGLTPGVAGGLGVERQPIKLEAHQGGTGSVEGSVAFKSGIVERSVQVPGRTETGPAGSRTFAPTESKALFYQSKEGNLFALPASVGQKRASLEARLIAAEGKGKVTASTVGRTLQAIGLGGSGVVAEYRNLITETPVAVQAEQPKAPAVQASVQSVSPTSIVASQGVPSREEQARAIFKAGETGFERYAGQVAEQARFVSKGAPYGDVLGDIAAGFVGVAGGTAKVAETAVRAPFVAGKAAFEIATQGRPSKETYAQVAGNVASFSESTPVSVFVNVEKTVGSESGQPVFREGEELKQALIGAGVGLGVGLVGARAASGLGKSSVTASESGRVLFTESRGTPAAILKKGTFETVGEAKTVFGQKVTVPAGGEITTLTTPKGTQSLVSGIARPGKETIPFVTRGLAREVKPGTSLGVEATFIESGKQRVAGTSTTASRTLAVTQEKAFQGQLGGKLPVGGTLDITKSAVAGKSEGQLSTGSTYRVKSKTLVEEPQAQLPQAFDRTQYFKPQGKVSVPKQGAVKQIQVTKVREVPVPTDTGVGKLAVQLASEKQAKTAQSIALGSKAVFSPKGYATDFQSTVTRPPQAQTQSRTLSPSFAVQFEPSRVQSERTLTGFAEQVSFAPATRQQERTVTLTKQLQRPAQESRFATEPRTQQRFQQFTQTLQPTATREQQFFRSLTVQPSPTFQVPKGFGGVFGGPKGSGFDLGRGGFKGGGLKGQKVKGRIPDLFNIGVTQKSTGRTTYTLPTTRRITKSRVFKRSGGFLSPTGEQLKGLRKTPRRLSRFF